ncbi:ABC-2 type transport system permease protein [Paenibacillus forsythiae]|uniref:ABC-2 type transport system permease protein n=1 Tax=Paenibacillus forsythiae TaxID=365616 RepID=A0ABU3H624_9BACL|nr:ABC transporter permease [Paenibacillus forsythiae]MDT3426185.1 ABC-2 type transport system permease protein [Paenibacillus forsythiae]
MQMFIMITKQLRLMLRNRTAMLAVMAAPILLAYLFSLSLDGGKTPVYVADADQSANSRLFIARLADHSGISVSSASEAEIRTKIGNSEITMGLVLDRGFGESVVSGMTPRARVLQSASNEDGAKLEPVIAEEIGALAKGTSAASPARPADITDSRKQEQTGQRLDGFMVMFLWFAVIQGFRTLVDERENGTLQRLLGTPVSFAKYLLSKTVASYLFGILNIAVILIAATYALDIRVAAIGPEALILASYLLALTGIVMLFVPFVKSHQNFTVYGSAITALTGILGGSFFPIDASAPEWIRAVSRCIPGYWTMQSLNSVAYHADSLRSHLLPVSLLAGTGAAGILISCTMITRKMRAQ